MRFRWQLDSHHYFYPSGRFEAYTFQYRERSLLSKALNNQMIALYNYITQSLVLETYTMCEQYIACK